AQTDALRGSASTTLQARPMENRRVRVQAADNVTLIRSGQEWTETEGRERALYLEDVEPVLRLGMDFLRDEGQAQGCHVNRYMRHVDADLQPLEKSFGLSYWRSLEHLERWSESHPTHVAIFGNFMRMVQAMNF